MSTALELAQQLEETAAFFEVRSCVGEAATELRRLDRVNKSLLKALKACGAIIAGETLYKQAIIDALELTRDAIKEANGTGEPT